MTPLLIAPHADDETLFAAYTCMRRRPYIVVCLPDEQDSYRRSHELRLAGEILDCPVEQLTHTSEYLIEAHFKLLDAAVEEVIAPAWEEDGHEEHNQIALLAERVFGGKISTRYLTYAPRGLRSRHGAEVEPTPDMIARKLRALGCYSSQIENPLTRPWFFDLLDLREWVA